MRLFLLGLGVLAGIMLVAAPRADATATPAATLIPAFTVSAAVPGQAATFDPTSTVSTAGVASATWDWGDGTTSSLSGSLTTTTHTFAGSGIYTVTLTVVDNGGNTASVTNLVSVGTDPTAVIGPLPAMATVGSAVPFSGSSSTDPNGTAIANFNWDFGDGKTGTGVTATHTYASPGTYTVTLVVNDSLGFAASVTATIDVVAAGRITAVSAEHSGPSAYVLVKVTQAGSISYAGAAMRVIDAGTERIRLKLTARQRNLLRQGRAFTLTVRLVYRPKFGKPVAENRRITL